MPTSNRLFFGLETDRFGFSHPLLLSPFGVTTDLTQSHLCHVSLIKWRKKPEHCVLFSDHERLFNLVREINETNSAKMRGQS
jgi:hypothetical protein